MRKRCTRGTEEKGWIYSGSANKRKKERSGVERLEKEKRAQERGRVGRARAELENAGATLKMETVVPGVDLPLVARELFDRANAAKFRRPFTT